MRHKPRNSAWVKRHVHGAERKRRVVSDHTKSSILAAYETTQDYDVLSNKFGLSKPYLSQFIHRHKWGKGDKIFADKNSERARKVDWQTRLLIRRVCLELYPHNTAAHIRRHLRDNYFCTVLSTSTITSVLKSMAMSHTRRNVIKRYSNANITKVLRQNWSAKMLRWENKFNKICIK